MTIFKNTVITISTNWKQLIENRIIRITVYSSIFIIVINILLLILFWNKLPPQVPLWFSRPWGLDRLASIFWMLLFPLGSLCWFILSSFISCVYAKEHLVFRQLLMFIALLTSFFSCITTIKIFSLVL